MPQIIKVNAGQRSFIAGTPTKMQSAVSDRPQTIMMSPTTFVPHDQTHPSSPVHETNAKNDNKNFASNSAAEEVNRTSVAYQSADSGQFQETHLMI
jgi:hypothetical protein